MAWLSWIWLTLSSKHAKKAIPGHFFVKKYIFAIARQMGFSWCPRPQTHPTSTAPSRHTATTYTPIGAPYPNPVPPPSLRRSLRARKVPVRDDDPRLRILSYNRKPREQEAQGTGDEASSGRIEDAGEQPSHSSKSLLCSSLLVLSSFVPYTGR